MSTVKEQREQVVAEIVKSLEDGTAPWLRPFAAGEALGHGPVNATTGKPYAGGNRLALATGAPTDDPRWATYKQIRAAGWELKPGSKGRRIELWKPIEKSETVEADRLDENGKKIGTENMELSEKRMICRHYAVFHASSIEGIPPLDLPKNEVNVSEIGEKILHSGRVAPIEHDQLAQAFYRPSEDKIHMPAPEHFHDAGHYYATAAHEAIHSTGHAERLNRETLKTYGDSRQDRAREELVAELGSYFLAQETGMPHHPENHTAYIGGWIQMLKDDPNALYKAAAEAGKAVDYALGTERQVEKAPEKGREVVEKVLGGEGGPKSWTGLVVAVADDKKAVEMKAMGQVTRIRADGDKAFPAEIKPGDYVKLRAGKDGPTVEPAGKERSKEKGKEKGRAA